MAGEPIWVRCRSPIWTLGRGRNVGLVFQFLQPADQGLLGAGLDLTANGNYGLAVGALLRCTGLALTTALFIVSELVTLLPASGGRQRDVHHHQSAPWRSW